MTDTLPTTTPGPNRRPASRKDLAPYLGVGATPAEAKEAYEAEIPADTYGNWRKGRRSHRELIRAVRHFGRWDLENYCAARRDGATEAEIHEAVRCRLSITCFRQGYMNGASVPEMVEVNHQFPLCFFEYLDARSSASHAEAMAVMPLGPYKLTAYGKLRDLSATHAEALEAMTLGINRDQIKKGVQAGLSMPDAIRLAALRRSLRQVTAGQYRRYIEPLSESQRQVLLSLATTWTGKLAELISTVKALTA